MRYLVRLSVPRAGGWRAWGTTRNEFGRQLAEQESAAAFPNAHQARSSASATSAASTVAMMTTCWTCRQFAGANEIAGLAFPQLRHRGNRVSVS